MPFLSEEEVEKIRTTDFHNESLNRGIRFEVVAKLLGHNTTRIKPHYAKLLKNNILNEEKDAFEKSY